MSSPSRPSNRNHQPFISLSLWQAVAQAPEMSPRKGMLNSCLLSVASGHTRKPFLLALNESLASFHRRGSPSLAIWGAPAGNSCVMTATAPAEAGLFLGPLGCLSAARAAAAAILALFFPRLPRAQLPSPRPSALPPPRRQPSAQTCVVAARIHTNQPMRPHRLQVLWPSMSQRHSFAPRSLM